MSEENLPQGNTFQEFVEELLRAEGFKILKRGGPGTDGGCDILVEIRIDQPSPFCEKWVVQSKWKARRDKTLNERDIGSIPHTCSHWEACGYLLVTNATPTEKLGKIFASFRGSGCVIPIKAAFWRFTDIRRLITEKHVDVGRTHFPEILKRVGSGAPPRAPNRRLAELFRHLKQGDVEDATRLAEDLLRVRPAKGRG